jgi:hypothetical protein
VVMPSLVSMSTMSVIEVLRFANNKYYGEDCYTPSP